MERFDMTDKLESVHSDIRGEIYRKALDMQKEGKKVLKLNTGNPASFGFKMPESVKNALLNNLDKATAYCDVMGMPESREAIADYHNSCGLKITPSDVFIGNGVSEIAQMISTALFNNGDEVMLPSPSYSLWTNCIKIAGAVPVFYTCDESNEWQPDIADIKKKVNSKTKAIIIINPNNPTGAVYSKEILTEIGNIARENKIAVISDEIYDRLLLDDAEYHSFAKINPDIPVITTNGLSKSHIICGFRCGWMVISDPENRLSAFRDGVMKIASMRLCSNALTQLVIPAALKDRASTNAMLVPGGRLYEQREACISVLNTVEGLSVIKNKAAFYIFPKLDKKKFNITSDKKFAYDFLISKNVLVIPGSGFDWNNDDHFRIVMLPEKEILRDAMLSLKDFLSDYKQK